MAKDKNHFGGPTQGSNDEPTRDRDNPAPHGQRASAQSLPIGDEERHERAEDRGETWDSAEKSRTGSDSNRSRKNRGG